MKCPNCACEEYETLRTEVFKCKECKTLWRIISANMEWWFNPKLPEGEGIPEVATKDLKELMDLCERPKNE